MLFCALHPLFVSGALPARYEEEARVGGHETEGHLAERVEESGDVAAPGY